MDKNECGQEVKYEVHCKHSPALAVHTLTIPLPVLLLQELGETALHLAVRLVDRTSLHIVDFLTQNRQEPHSQSSRTFTLVLPLW